MSLPPEYDSWLRPEDEEPAGTPESQPGNEDASATRVEATAIDPQTSAPEPPLAIPVIPAPKGSVPQPAAPPVPAQPVIPVIPAPRSDTVAPLAATRPPSAVPPSATPPRKPSVAPGSPPSARGRNKRRHPWRRRILWLLVAFGVYLTSVVVVFALAVNKIPDPAFDALGTARGMNVLIVGSDSRAGLTEEQQAQLSTGSVEGQRTDTIMLLNIPLIGTPTLISIPRDSWVEIPGHGSGKINSAYAIGGPALLADTIENATGLAVTNYIEVGFAGIANTTDALGGVVLCPADNYNDVYSGLNVSAGCQVMDGTTSLAYVRMRYQDPKGDLGRIERQQEYISAVAKKALSPLTWLLPWRAYGTARAAGSALTVNQSTNVWDLGRVGFAMGMISLGWGDSTTVPTEPGTYRVNGQDALKWNSPEAKKLFDSVS